MRILVVGAGSTGGYFGGRMAQAGRDITFLVRPARAAALRASGLHIISPHGDVTLAPALVTADTITGPFDAILLTVKAFSLDVALDDLTPAVGPETMILPVLNGMKHMDGLTARFGRRPVIGCACKIATTVDDQGRIVQRSPLQDIAYGEMDGTVSARVQRLHRTFQGAGFDARLSTAIEQEMWEKWILLASMGAITCLMRGTIGEIEAAPGGTAFALALLGEVTAIITGLGHPPSEAFLAGARTALTQKASPQTSSMYRDMDRGHPVEVEQILGDLLLRGSQINLATPLLSAAYANLSVYRNRLVAR